MRKNQGKSKKKTTKTDVCEEEVTHPEAIRKVFEKLPPERVFPEMSEFFKAFSSSTRVKILTALATAELCVCDIAQVLGLSASSVSHQLALLRTMRLIKHRRDGKQVYYSLDDEHITAILAIAREHIGE